jgi:hypothetical protein
MVFLRIERKDVVTNAINKSADRARSARALTCLCGTLVAIGLGACGGGGESSTAATASVGDCINSARQVVDCDSSSATQKLVSDQSAKDAIACIQIGSNPQVQVKVSGGEFCAQDQ